ncbi:nitrate reductase [Serpentinimonas barnesii]|uniref:nitrate reductase n=1 Tax=Serpentinimonas barnesii TaxID=1458427 RepID=UPI0004977E6E|nr:nitrate reductase [Serpentinimonas barnesii]
MATTRSTCPYCGVGCGVLIEHEGGQITGVRGDPEHPANFGRLCSKGSTLHLSARPALAQATRLLHPQWRSARGGPTQALDWKQALDLAASRIAQTVQQHGPDAVGVYVSGQLLTEDYYVFNKLVKGVLGSNQIDSNSRLCMSSAVAGYKLTLGADAPPPCYEDLGLAQTLFIIGSNTAWAHPVLFRRIEDARAARPDLRLIVADPRRTDTAASADLHLPLQPGTDVALLHGLLHIMLWEGWLDPAYIAAHTSGFEALKAILREHTPAHTAHLCGLQQADLYTAARWIAGLDSPAQDGPPAPTAPLFSGRDGRLRRPTLSLYCQGLNQSSNGSANNAALIHLHLATGQIGHPGAGPLSLTGQPNAMGGREVGAMANLLSAHRDLANPTHRAEVAQLWGVPSVPGQPGRSAVQMFQAAAEGEVKLLWIACTNPAQSLPDQSTVRRALERAEFVIVQEAFAHTASTAYADLLLPATTWGEKEGTVSNSERCISRVRRAVPAPLHPDHALDGPRPDWVIARDVAQRLEALLHPQPDAPRRIHFDYPTPEAVWNEHRQSTQGRDLDISGLSYALLDTAGPQQWPMPEGQSRGLARLYADGRFPTSDGKARFVALPYRAPAEARDASYPLALNTGRLRDQWHGMSRTGLLGRLFGHAPEPVLHMHPQDMARRRLREGELVSVQSARGRIVLPLQAAPDLGLGQVYLPMHWGSDCLSGRSPEGLALLGVNALTTPACCPTSQQPELKHAAVRVEPAHLPWTLIAMAWLPEGEAAQTRAWLSGQLSQFDFATCVPFGRHEEQGRTGVLLRAACLQAPDPALLDAVAARLGLNTPNTLCYRDPRRGQMRALRLLRRSPESEAQLDALLLASDVRSAAWLEVLLQEERPTSASGQQLLLPSAAAPTASGPSSRSPQVCACLDVSEQAITLHLARSPGSPSQRLAQLQSTLQCGTQCGSCIPQLKRLLQSVAAPAMAANTQIA